MPLQVKPIGEPYHRPHVESDISDAYWETEGMRFVVEFWKLNDDSHKKEFVEVHFPKFCRYRILEEADLVPYWESKEFSSGHLAYEILSGGWISSDATGEKLLGWANACGVREWFICTSNWSASILSKEEPLIRVLKN